MTATTAIKQVHNTSRLEAWSTQSYQATSWLLDQEGVCLHLVCKVLLPLHLRLSLQEAPRASARLAVPGNGLPVNTLALSAGPLLVMGRLQPAA